MPHLKAQVIQPVGSCRCHELQRTVGQKTYGAGNTTTRGILRATWLDNSFRPLPTKVRNTGSQPRRLGAISQRCVKKGPGTPISLVSADRAVPAGPALMPYPVSQAGPVPGPLAVPCPAGTGELQSGT